MTRALPIKSGFQAICGQLAILPNRFDTEFVDGVSRESLNRSQVAVDFSATYPEIPTTFNLVAPAVVLTGLLNAMAILAGFGLRWQHAMVRMIASFIVWLYVIGPGMVNAIAHVPFSFVARSLVVFLRAHARGSSDGCGCRHVC
jgi:hypothetical protein